MVLATTLCSAVCAAPATGLDLGASLRHDDNLSNSLDRHDRASDQILRLDASARRDLLDESGTGLRFRGQLGAEHLRDFDDLDRLDLRLGADWVLVPRHTYGDLSVALTAELEGFVHRDSDLRDGGALTLGLLLRDRLTDRLELTGGARHAVRRSREGDLFDLDRSELFLRMDLDTGRRTGVWLGIDAGVGDTVANVARSGASILPIAEALAVDPVFGAGLLGGPGAGPGAGTNRVSYRIDARAVAVRAGVLFMPAPDLGIEVAAAYRRFEARDDDEVGYDGLEVVLAIVRRLR
ncbi:MAG TPA: hypothetical protein VLA56_08425 [Pseudomonadales bacterium]|nr:hypothetical protein [Pseudomonadales bacterium]